jgi:dihydrofolate synthase/folylpolyglutamate synthase
MNDSDIKQLFSLKNEYRSLRYDLANIRVLCDALGNPHHSFRSALIAGTNGKGAVARWLSGMIPGSGLYLSPHLVRLNERFSVGGREIDDRQLQSVHDDVQRAVKDAGSHLIYPPTYFERVTAMAFQFLRGRADYAVIEVGLGGRLDATNVLNQDLSAITSIGFDHQEYLGFSLDEIAGEKAGIIKETEPVVVGPRADFECIRRKAANRLIDAGRLRPELKPLGAGLYEVDLETPVRTYSGLRPTLAGRHQVDNLMVAISAGEALEALGWPIDSHSIQRSVNDAEWPGRLETFPGEPTFIIDGCHNVDAARAVAAYVEENHPEGLTLIFGAMADKDYEQMLGILGPGARNVVVTCSSNDRAVPSADLQRICPSAVLTTDVSEAIQYVTKNFSHDTVLIAGSLYLAGEARAILQSMRETA